MKNTKEPSKMMPAQNRPAALLVMFALVVLLSLTATGSGVPTGVHGIAPRQSADSVTPVTMLQRPKIWINQLAPTKPEKDALRTFEKLASLPYEFEPRREPGPTDVAVLGLVERAKSRITNAAPTNVWELERVKARVAQIGKTVPLFLLPPTTDARTVLVYDVMNDRVGIKPELLTQAHPDAMAALLFHEATHGAFKQVMLEQVALTGKELFRLSYSCADIDLMISFASEALAWLNQVALCDTFADKGVCDVHGIGNTLEAARSARAGSATGRRTFGMHLQTMAQQQRIQAIAGLQQQATLCGPPVRLHGARRGTFFFPSDIAPATIVPLLDASQD